MGRGVSEKDSAAVYSVAGGRIGLLSLVATSIADMGIGCQGERRCTFEAFDDDRFMWGAASGSRAVLCCRIWPPALPTWVLTVCGNADASVCALRVVDHARCVAADALHSVVEAAADEFKVRSWWSAQLTTSPCLPCTRISTCNHTCFDVICLSIPGGRPARQGEQHFHFEIQTANRCYRGSSCYRCCSAAAACAFRRQALSVCRKAAAMATFFLQCATCLDTSTAARYSLASARAGREARRRHGGNQ